MSECSQPECDRPVFAKGKCHKHYDQHYAAENKSRRMDIVRVYFSTEKGLEARRRGRLRERILRFLNRASLKEILKTFPTLSPQSLAALEVSRRLDWKTLKTVLSEEDYAVLRSLEIEPTHLRYTKS